MSRRGHSPIIYVALVLLSLAPLFVAACTESQHSNLTWTSIGGTTTSLDGVWGVSASDVFAVGIKGTILHYDGSSWSAMSSGTDVGLHAVWGTSASDVFAVGDDGNVLHYNGSSWSAMNSATTNNIYGVWGSSSTDVFAVGGDGNVLHYDGSSWSAMSSGTSSVIQDVWGSSASDVFAVGLRGIFLHYDGSSWSPMSNGTTGNLYSWGSWQGVWGSSSTDVFAVEESGTILHYNGSTWSAMNSGTTYYLSDVWGSSSSDVFAVGREWVSESATLGSNILHYNGNTWSSMSGGTDLWLDSVWGTSASDVFAVGNGGIVHYSPTSPSQTASKDVPWWAWPVVALVLLSLGGIVLLPYWLKKKDRTIYSGEGPPTSSAGYWGKGPLTTTAVSKTTRLDEIAGFVRQALENMDSSGKRYADEEAANSELETSLKFLLPHDHIECQARIRDNTTVDLKIGNILIEGKLDLQHKTEADRLSGQLDGYCLGTTYGVVLVVYGEISKSIRDSIERKIHDHYPDRVRLVALQHPKRTRRRTPGSPPLYPSSG